MAKIPRLALHCFLQLMQAPVRIVFYLRVREAWIDLKNKNDAKNEREPRINGMIVYIYIYYSILQLYS